jgi:hypothetical protein
VLDGAGELVIADQTADLAVRTGHDAFRIGPLDRMISIIIMALQGIEWVILEAHSGKSAVDIGFFGGLSGGGIWQDEGWPKQRSADGVCRMDILLAGFGRGRPCGEFSAIRT